ncbi:NADH-ubiquinone oxidoreductase-F iron-sulfur binding region domain-containing protein [Nonomuraea sp. NPDC048916]|uniref:NADH-ubiquinone oxidoreductase-F iron-sulfur binding region domain-containing protein n=1 Tax=Nonomuraea sp. NPDC048916 TaxID=3154232 RepID=UPI0033C07D4C
MRFPITVRSLGAPRLLLDETADEGEPASSEIVQIAEAAGIRGRGGAGFPLAVKLRSITAADLVIANGAEGEPTSVKDRFLLRERPALVLRGLRLAARAVGAGRACVYLSDHAAAVTLRRLAPDGVDIIEVPPGYVAGEETAAVRAIGGGPALPTAKPPRPWQSGILVCNVETLAQLALAARLGPAAYRMTGTADSPGTLLVTLSGAGRTPALFEVPYGVRLGDVVRSHLGRVDRVTGVLAGGFAGGLLPARALDLPLTHAAFAGVGSTLGCGAFVLLAGDCPIGVAAEVARFLDRENARQCGPCVKGLQGVAETLDRLVIGSATGEDVDRLERWGAALPGRGNCATPDAASVLIGSLFRHHRPLVRAHVGTACPACVPADFRIPVEET